VCDIMWKNTLEPGRSHGACASRVDNDGHKHTLIICSTYCFSTNNGCMTAPQCYVIRTLAVLLFFIFTSLMSPDRLWNSLSLLSNVSPCFYHALVTENLVILLSATPTVMLHIMTTV